MNDKKLLKQLVANTTPKPYYPTTVEATKMLTDRRRIYPILARVGATVSWTVPRYEVWEVLALTAVAGFAGLGTDETILVAAAHDGINYWEYHDPSGGANGLQLRMAKGWGERTAYTTGGIIYACAPCIPFYLIEDDVLTVAGAGLGAGDTLQVGMVLNIYSSEEVRA